MTKDAGIPLVIAGGIRIVVPATLRAMTTYVALEQEDWFEKELDFVRRWLKPGMRAIDVGAGLGMYSLAMARAVGDHGAVWAFEPATATAAMQRRSAELNGLPRLNCINAALSDAPGRAWLGFRSTSELNALVPGGPSPDAQTNAGEEVAVTSLDAEDARQEWGSPDFVKIDAEGQEAQIVAGGADFFSRHAPLVMFEVKAGSVVDLAAASSLVAMGYDTYRLVPGGPVLVPQPLDLPLEGYELNLFAARPERAARLAAAGLLVRPAEKPAPSSGDGLALLRAQPFARAFPQWGSASLSPDYRHAVDQYAVWRDVALAPAARHDALLRALATLTSLCATDARPGALSTLARAAMEAGARRQAVAASRRLLENVRADREMDEPFWPAWPAFDVIPPGAPAVEWAAAAAATAFERQNAFSTYFVPPTEALDWLCASRFASAAMMRRHVLPRAARGRDWIVHPLLTASAPDHRNPELWRSRLAAFL